MPRVIIPDFSSGEVAPDLFGRVDTNEYRKGLRTGRNVFVHSYGGVSNRPGTLFVGPCKNHENVPRLIPFRFRTGDSYMIEMGAGYFRFLRDGYHVLEEPEDVEDVQSENGETTITITDHPFEDGDEVYITGLDGMTRLNGDRFVVYDATANDFKIQHQVSGLPIDTGAEDPWVAGGTVARIYEIENPYLQSELRQIKFDQSGDIVTLVHRNHPPKELRRMDHTDWELVDIDFDPAVDTPDNFAVTPQGTSGSTTYRYRVTAIQDETFLESAFAQAETNTGNATLDATNFNRLTWDAVADAFRYNIYKEDGGLWGFLATTESLQFDDIGEFLPNFNDGPPVFVNPFDSPGNFPGAVGLYQQRRLFASTFNRPDTWFASVVGDFKNFSTSFPRQDSDAMTVTLAQGEVNEIRHILPRERLFMFTSGSEWAIDQGADGPFTFETLRQQPQTFWGISHTPPIAINKLVLFIQDLDSTIRSFGYSLQEDGFITTDLTVVSRHLFRGRLLGNWTHSSIPESMIYAIRNDGQMLVLTFVPDQNVLAWTHYDTDGLYEQVSELPNGCGGGEHEMFMVVRRTVNGQSALYIERQFTREVFGVQDQYFVDSGLTLDDWTQIENIEIEQGEITVTTETAHGLVDGDEIDLDDIVWSPVVDQFFNEDQPEQLNGGRFLVAEATLNSFKLHTLEDDEPVNGSGFRGYVGDGVVRKVVNKIWGLHHLVGKTIVMLGNGNVYEDIVVNSDGSVDLPEGMSRIHAGLRYISDIELMEFEAPQGTIQHLHKRVPSVTLRMKRSKGLFIGPSRFQLTEWKIRDQERFDEPVSLFTGDHHITFIGQWDRQGVVFMRQIYPLPMTLLAAIPDFATGEIQAE
jgi:hypothetical protein